MELICRCIYFSFKFLYLSGSFDTTKNYVPENSYACLSLKLCAEIHWSASCSPSSEDEKSDFKAEVLTDTIKQTFLNGSKEAESNRYKPCSLLYTETLHNDYHCHMFTCPMVSRVLSHIMLCYTIQFNFITSIIISSFFVCVFIFTLRSI